MLKPVACCFIAILISATVYSQVDSTTKAIPVIQKVERAFYGQASFYADKFNGRHTASGELFSQEKYTAACNVLPLGTWIRITNLVNGNSVVVKTNDRLHPKMRRLVDLSRVAAEKLNFIKAGVTRVRIEVLQ